MTTEQKYSPYAQKSKQFDIITFGATCGGCFVALVQLSSLSAVSPALMFAIYSFAIAIPLLVGAFFGRHELLNLESTTLSKEIALHCFGLVGLLAASSGVAAMFFHFSSLAGWAFIIMSVATLVIVNVIVHGFRP